MKKIIPWFLKNVPIINMLLLINLIALLIIDFGIYLSGKSINILLALAAICSTFFLFLAFKESKKANDYSISLPLFQEFEQQIENLKLMSNENLFSDFTRNYINHYIKKDLVNPQDITFSKFIYQLKSLYKEISKTPTYNHIMEKLGFAESTVIPTDPDILNKVYAMTIIFNDIQISIFFLYHNYNRIYKLCNSIDQSVLFKVQKQILIARLDLLCSEYEIISKAMLEEDTNLKQVLYFNTFKINTEQLVVRFTIKFHDQMKNVYNKIQQLKKIRDYPPISFEDQMDITPI